MLFTSNVVNQVLKTNQPELSQWIVRGFVKPTQPAMGGTGTRNLYSAETVCQIQIFLDLSECGLRRPVASTIAFDTDILRIIGEIVEGAKVKNLLAPGIYLSVVRKPEKWQAIVIRGTGEMLSLYQGNHGLILLLNLDRLVKTIKTLLEVIQKFESVTD